MKKEKKNTGNNTTPFRTLFVLALVLHTTGRSRGKVKPRVLHRDASVM